MTPDTFTSEVRVLPSGMPRSDPEARHYAVIVQYKGTYVQRGTVGEQDWYAIENGGSSLSRAGKWKWLPQKFQRWQYRHTFAEAVALATEHVDSVTVNGRTWAERQVDISRVTL